MKALRIAPGFPSIQSSVCFAIDPPNVDPAKKFRPSWFSAHLFSPSLRHSKPRDQDSRVKYPLVLPSFGYRFDLKALDGHLRKQTLLSVDTEFTEDIDVYLTSKFLVGSKVNQATFLRGVGQAVIAHEVLPRGCIREISRNALDDVPDEDTVEASKIGLVYRTHPMFFRKWWGDLACHISDRGVVPCLMANAGLLGFASFIRAQRGDIPLVSLHTKEEHPYALVFHRASNDRLQVSIIEPGHVKYFLGSRKVAIIDDVIKSGNTVQRGKELLGGAEVESYFCIMRV